MYPISWAREPIVEFLGTIGQQGGKTTLINPLEHNCLSLITLTLGTLRLWTLLRELGPYRLRLGTLIKASLRVKGLISGPVRKWEPLVARICRSFTNCHCSLNTLTPNTLGNPLQMNNLEVVADPRPSMASCKLWLHSGWTCKQRLGSWLLKARLYTKPVA